MGSNTPRMEEDAKPCLEDSADTGRIVHMIVTMEFAPQVKEKTAARILQHAKVCPGDAAEAVSIAHSIVILGPVLQNTKKAVEASKVRRMQRDAKACLEDDAETARTVLSIVTQESVSLGMKKEAILEDSSHLIHQA